MPPPFATLQLSLAYLFHSIYWIICNHVCLVHPKSSPLLVSTPSLSQVTYVYLTPALRCLLLYFFIFVLELICIHLH